MKFNTLNDGTNGFRFNVLGQQGLYRKRSLYWESKGAVRMLHNLAGGK